MTVNSDRAQPTSAEPTAIRLDRRTRITLVGVALAAFVSVLNGTTVTALLGPLGTALQADLATIVWVTTSYLIAASLALPLTGWLTDRFGARTVMLVGVAGFVGGSLLCAFAWDVSSLIAFRLIQGAAGGMLEPTAMAIAGMITPRARMGRVMGLISMVINVGPIAGPLIGSLLINLGGWRWIFLINVPLGLVVAVIAWRFLDRGTGDRTGTRIDLIGLALLPPGFVLILLGINRWGAGADSLLTWPLCLVGLIMIAGYLRHALRTSTPPLLDVRLLRIAPFAAALMIMSAVGLTMYVQLTVLPLFGERALDQLAGLAGFAQALPVAALGLGLLVSMTWSAGASDQRGPRVLVRVGATGTAVVAVLILLTRTTLPANAATPILFGLFVLVGLFFGCIAAPTFSSVYRVLPAADIAQGNTAMFIVVQLFASAGVTAVALITAVAPDVLGGAYLFVGVLALITLILSHWLPGRPVADGIGHSPG